MTTSDLHQLEISLKQCVLLVFAAQHRNRQALAQALFTSTSSVTRALTEMESCLNLTLFDRFRGNIQLTEVGARFLEHAQRIYDCLMDLLSATNTDNTDKKVLAQRARRVTILQIKCFLKVAEVGGFVAASRLLGVSQSSVSRAVRDLELTLRVSLISRASEQTRLTTTGATALPLAQQLLVLHTETCSTVALWRGKKNRKVMIAGSLAILPQATPLLLSKLSDEFPQCEVSLKSELSERVEAAVIDGTALVGLCGVVSEKPEFIYTHLLKVQMGVICSQSMCMPDVVNCLDDFSSVSFIRFDDSALMTQALLSTGHSFDAYFNSNVTVSSVEAGIDLVRHGKHAMLVTGVGAGTKMAGDLKFTALPGILPTINVSIIRKRNGLFDRHRERVVDVIRQCIVNMRWHPSIKTLADS